LKEAELDDDALKVVNINNEAKELNILAKDSYITEFRIMDFLTDNIQKGGSPNFLMSYDAAICETCGDDMQDTCFMSFMEPAVGSLDKTLYKFPGITDDIIYSLVYQLFLGMCTLHFKYGIHHRDIKADNILILKVPGGGYFKYVMDDKEYFVQNKGFIACLHDFGISSIYNPIYSASNHYGTRNARVNTWGKLEPITCGYGIDIGRKGNFKRTTETEEIEWNTGKISTNNVFTKDIRLVPDIDVKLEDTRQFPPFEFFNDLQNLVGLLTGGHGYVIFDLPFDQDKSGYDHSEWGKLNLPEDLDYKLQKLVMEEFDYDLDNAIFLRADMMLDYLYEKPIGIGEKDVVQTFNVL
jgi:serine/threonine protein kinase